MSSRHGHVLPGRQIKTNKQASSVVREWSGLCAGVAQANTQICLLRLVQRTDAHMNAKSRLLKLF